MKCGQFEKRNKKYYENFSIKKYFKKLILEGGGNVDSNTAEKKIIIDVGAHKGESAQFFNELLPDSLIYSIEPVPEHAQFIRNLNLPNVLVSEMALSDCNDTAEFNVQDVSHLSSLYKINKESEYSIDYAEKEKHNLINVKVQRGDLFVKEVGLDVIDFLKIDVQANEVNVLSGFSSVIDRVKVVFVEISMYDFYEHRSKIREVEELLPGFYIYDIYEISKNPKTLGTDWATFVYINNNV